MRSLLLVVVILVVPTLGIMIVCYTVYYVMLWVMAGVTWARDRWRRWREAVLRVAAGEAAWRHLGGNRGRRGRRAWGRLTRAGNAGNPLAADLVWRVWLAAPDDEGWALLSRWQSSTARGHLLVAASSAQTDAGDRAALGAFCARHGLRPHGPAEQAEFYALTGQPEQRRAVDPDGALLAAAYRAASPDVRTALRESLAGEGDLAVVRVVVAGAGLRSRAADLTAAETDYLVRRLAGSRDWAGLWELAKDLPVVEAAGAVALIDAGWRPDRQRDRDLYALISELPPGAVAEARAALRTRIEVPGPVVAGALSPGGRRLAVAIRKDGQSPAATVLSYRLPGGSLAGACQVPARDRTALLYTKRKKLIAVDSAFGTPGQQYSTRMYRCPDAGRAELAAHGGFGTAALAVGRRGFAAITADGYLEFHDDTGARPASQRLRLAGTALSEGSRVTLPTADTASGRIVVARDGQLTVVEQARRSWEARILAWDSLPNVVRGRMHGSSHVIVARSERLERWRLELVYNHDRPRPRDRPEATSTPVNCIDMVMISERDEICVLGGSGARYLDADSLQAVGEPRELSGRTGSSLWASADGITHALGGDGFVDVATRELADLRALADRPQAAWRPSDLGTALRAAPVIKRCPAGRPLYALVVACLEHRFPGEVRLGRVQTWAGGPADHARDDDIALGDPPGEHGGPGNVSGPEHVAGMQANRREARS